MLEKLTTALQTLLPYQPLTYTWLAVTALGIMIFTAARKNTAEENWRQRLIVGLAKALAFIGLVVLVVALLGHNYATFSAVYGSFTTGGSLSNQAFEPWHALYGESLIQHELEVTQFVKETSLVPIEPDGPNQPVRYVDVTVENPLEQDSISAFNGHVTLNLVNPQQQEDSFNAFTATAHYEYEVSNTSDQVTRADYHFPIDSNQRSFRDIHIRVNGEEFNDWEVNYDSLDWDLPMQAGQVDKVEIQYTTWGMNDYAYEVDQAREVRNFQLSLAFETDNH